MSTYNTNTNGTNKETKNPYGHLLDKYLDSNHVDWETRQQREKEAKSRYGHLIGYAKPDNFTLELMAKMEDDRIERRKQMEEERKLDALRRQEQIEAVKRREAYPPVADRQFQSSIYGFISNLNSASYTFFGTLFLYLSAIISISACLCLLYSANASSGVSQ